MDIKIVPIFGKQKKKNPTKTKTEGVAVTEEMKEDLRKLKYQGLEVGEMAREYLERVIAAARAGEFENVKLPGEAS